MKHRVISILLVLLLLIVPTATGVFAVDGGGEAVSTTAEPVPPTEPDPEAPMEAAETSPAVTESAQETAAPLPTEPVTEPAATEPAEPVTEPAPEPPVETEPAATEAAATEPAATEPQAEPQPEPPAAGSCRLILRVEPDDETEAQSFLFTLRGGDLVLQLAIPAGETEILVTGLEPGTYTVTEERSWSWRYDSEAEQDALTKTVTLTGGSSQQLVRFRPAAGTSPWLSACAGGDGR